jgi:hypothetical protein
MTVTPQKIVHFFRSKNLIISGKPMLSARRIIYFCYLYAKRLLKLDVSFYPPEVSNLTIDIFMPVIEKDAQMLPLSLDGIRSYIKHPINKIFIVGPDSAVLKRIAQEKNCQFIDESTILPIKKADLGYKPNGVNRSGWLFKQLINLYSDTVFESDYALILDADTVFIGPQIFMYHNKQLLNLSDEYHQPYFEINRKLLGKPHQSSHSFITHYMFVHKPVLQQLRNAIEKYAGTKWYEAILKNLDRDENSGFADYEIYGDFLVNRYPGQQIFNYWSNLSMQINRFSTFGELQKKLHNKYRSISLHNYEEQK